MATSNTDPLLGSTLGDYTITRMIAKGGMGRVYEANDNQLDRKAAIKVITLDEERAAELMTRFKREAQAISKLDNHPNIVTVYRFGEESGVHYLAMEFVEGQTLAEYEEELRLGKRQLNMNELLYIFQQIGAALDHAHQRAVIHRDIKPANIMLQPVADHPYPKAILMDFGLVMQLDTASTLGSAFGTPRYIAPEQAMSSQQACAESDQYSLAVVIYELLAGQPPFSEDDSPMSVALSHITKEPPPLSLHRPDLPDAVDQVIMRALAKKPDQRFDSAGEFIQALAAAIQGTTLAKQSTDDTETMDVAPPFEIAIPAAAAPETDKKDEKRLKRRKRRRLRWRLGCWTGIAMGLLIVFVVFPRVGIELADISGNSANNPTPDTLASATGTIAPTPTLVPFPTIDEPVLEFYYPDNTLTVRNGHTASIRLVNVELRRGDVSFSLRDFGVSRLTNWPSKMCASIIVEGSEFDPPEACRGNETSAIEYINTSNFTWTNVTGPPSFKVYQNNNLLGECNITDGSCKISGIELSE